MKNVIVLPWVGKYYSKNGYNGKKIMILGESHYCNSRYECKSDHCWASIHKKCNSRKDLIERYLNYKKNLGDFEKWFNTYTKFSNAFIGEDVDFKVLNHFWNSIIFYNYVQKPIGRPRKKPTLKMFKDSENAFFEIIKRYDPDIIFVWGNRLWKQLPNEYFYEGKNVMGKPSGFYNNKIRNIPTFFLNHPSSGFKKAFWVKYIKKILKKNEAIKNGNLSISVFI